MARVKLYYGGIRLDGNGKKHQAFYREDGTLEGYWSGISRVFVGSAYWADSAGDKMTMKRRPESADEDYAKDHKDYRKWYAEHHAALNRWKVQNVKKRAESAKALLAEIPVIKRFVKDLSFTEKRAFSDWLVSQIEAEENAKFSAEINAWFKRAMKRQAKASAKKSK